MLRANERACYDIVENTFNKLTVMIVRPGVFVTLDEGKLPVTVGIFFNILRNREIFRFGCRKPVRTSKTDDRGASASVRSSHGGVVSLHDGSFFR